LMAPILWVALFNLVGLKRIVERLTDLESVNETILLKSRSLQTQISKKSVKTESPEEDHKISEEIRQHMHTGIDTKPSVFPFNRGGVRNADTDWVPESS